MHVSDPHLRLRFMRQPRAIGTNCLYAPMNTLLQHPDLEVGADLRIVALPQSKTDLYIRVVRAGHFPSQSWSSGPTVSEEWIKNNPPNPDHVKEVIWKDLVQ